MMSSPPRTRQRSPGLRIACSLLASLSLFTLPYAQAEDDPRKPPAIVTAEVPVVPAEVYTRLAQYENTRDASFAGWSPDGRGMLIRTRFGNSTQLHRVYSPGGRREQITFFEEPVTGGFLPKSNDDAILVSLSAGGNENYQVRLLLLKEHRITLLTDGKSRNELGPATHDGSRVIIESNRRNTRDSDIYIVDPRQPDAPWQLLKQVESEAWNAHDWSPDAARLLLNKFVSVNEAYPAIMHVADKKLEMLPRPGDNKDSKASFSHLKFSHDGKSVYLMSDANGEFNSLARLDLATSKYTWLTADLPHDIEQLEVDRATGKLAYTANVDGQSRLFVSDGDKGKSYDKVRGIIARLEFSPDGGRLGFTLARPTGPADAWSLDLKDGSLTQWTFSESGGLDPSEFVEPSLIRFPTFDERKIPAWYYKPRTASKQRPAPVLIEIHGGPESQSRPYFSGITQFYVGQLGMAVISPNVRGSAGQGKNYLTLDNGPKREDSVRDIGALLDWIKTQPDLDASRVVVSGGSYGGYMVLASLVHYGDRIKGGIDVVGIANFITFLEQTAPYRRDLRRAEYGDERDPAMRAVFEKINPAANAEKIRSALLVVHGKNDPRVPFAEAQQIAEKVRAQKRPVWTVYAENEGHGFGRKDNRDYLRAVVVMFLKDTLELKLK